jgi:hypothetical protein
MVVVSEQEQGHLPQTVLVLKALFTLQGTRPVTPNLWYLV